MNEAAFSGCGKRRFFQRDDLALPEAAERKRTIFHNLEWGPSPEFMNFKILRTPPKLLAGDVPHKPFSFNLNPDCTFWLLNSPFKSDCRNAVSR